MDDDGETCCESTPGRRWGLAIALCCPLCAGTLVFGIGTALGVGAAALKGGLLAGAVALVAALWIRNAWQRRGETSQVPDTSPAGEAR